MKLIQDRKNYSGELNQFHIKYLQPVIQLLYTAESQYKQLLVEHPPSYSGVTAHSTPSNTPYSPPIAYHIHTQGGNTPGGTGVAGMSHHAHEEESDGVHGDTSNNTSITNNSDPNKHNMELQQHVSDNTYCDSMLEIQTSVSIQDGRGSPMSTHKRGRSPGNESNGVPRESTPGGGVTGGLDKRTKSHHSYIDHTNNHQSNDSNSNDNKYILSPGGKNGNTTTTTTTTAANTINNEQQVDNYSQQSSQRAQTESPVIAMSSSYSSSYKSQLYNKMI